MGGATSGTVNQVRRFTDSTTPLAGNASFTGTTRTTDTFSRFRAKVVADQAGTLFIDQSIDGSTWDNTISTPISANNPIVIESICTDLNTRVRYTNGSSAQGTFRLSSALVMT